jgi:hypothetical protein
MKPGLRIRIVTVALLATLLVTTVAACQGGSQPAPPPPPGGNQPPVAEISSISPSQVYLGEDVLLTGQGKDKDGQVVGYEWRSSIDGLLGESDSIVTSALSEGEHTIYFAVRDNSGEWSEAVSAELTVLAQAQEVTREQAAVKVVEEVLEPLNLGSPTIGFKLDETLKPGDTVAPHGGQGQPVDEESYFFFVDLMPGAFYAHDVLFILVGKDDGWVEISSEEWWPEINGQTPDWLCTEAAYWDSANWFYNQGVSPPTQAQIPPPQVPPPQQQQFSEAAVVVNGYAEGETLSWDMAMSCWRMWELFDSIITPDNTFEITPPPTGSNSPADVLALLADLCDDGYNHIIVYMVGHGSIDSISIGGERLTAETLVNFLNNHPDTYFSILMESCHIGSFIDDLSALPNVYLALTSTSSLFLAYGDIDRDVDPNGDIDSGAEWTSSLYFGALERLTEIGWSAIGHEAAMLSLPNSVVLLLAAFNNMTTTDSFDLNAGYLLNKQFPQVWCPLGAGSSLWQELPDHGEISISAISGESGYITASGDVNQPLFHFLLGDSGQKKVFLSFEFPYVMPAGTILPAADIHMDVSAPIGCEPGYLGEMVVERLAYGNLNADDFDSPGVELARMPVWFSEEHGLVGCSVFSVKDPVQEDIDARKYCSKYRISFIGEVELDIFSANLIYYYELR